MHEADGVDSTGYQRRRQGVWNSHCNTQHPVRASRGAGDGATRLMVGNIGIRVLQETKLTGGIHMQRISGYTVWDTEADSRHRGGILVVWRDAEGWGG